MSEPINTVDELLARCQWPHLPDQFDKALRRAVSFVLHRFTVCGIIACGTIIRGQPDPSSDLDIYVIHREPFRQRIQKLFCGVPTEIFVNPPAAIEGYLVDEQTARRPLTAHMLVTGVVVLELDPVVSALRQKAQGLLAAPPKRPSDLTMRRYMIATLYEDALDVTEREPTAARLLLGVAVYEMLKFCFVRAGRFLPRNKDLLQAIGKMDDQVGRLAKQFLEASQLSTQVELAERIADRTIGARGFFEWETEPEPVAHS